MRIFKPASMGKGVRICSTGAYLPDKRVTNEQLVAQGAPLTADDIVRLSGIQSRHHAAEDQATSDLATHACRQALERARMAPSDVDRLIVGTVSPDHLSPSCACFVQKALGLGHVPSFDLTASCSGFLYALDVGARSVVTGDRAVLAVAADIRTRFLDPSDRATCALFGDGAGAAVLTEGPVGKGLVAVGLLADGTGAHSVYVPAGGSREPASAETVEKKRHSIRMAEGPQVYLAAVEGMVATAEALLGSLGMTFGDVDLLVPHQPNRRILDRLSKIGGVPLEKMVVNVERIGNVSGASCAIAFDEAMSTGRIPHGAKVLLVAAGAGYTAGAALYVAD